MSVDIILKDIEWDGVNKIRVPLEGGGTQDFSIGGGVTPTGNINITHSGQTDVTNYATATVPTADANAGSISPSYVTENNQRKWKFTYEGYAESPGWVDEGAFGSPLTYEYNAIPSNTTITPTTSAQTIGGQNYMMEGAVTVSAVPSMTLPSATSSTPTGTNKANILPSTSQRYLNIPAGLNETAQYYQIIGMDLAPLNVTQNGTYNASTYDVSGFNTVSVNVPGSTPNLQTKTRTYTPAITEQREVISADSGYDGLLAVGITVDPMPTLTLPSVASMSSVGTRKAKIYQSNYTQYWNIGTGYHAVAEYYEIPPLLVDTKTITTNGTYNAIDEDLDGYSSVTVNVPSGSPTLQTKSATYTPTTSQQTDTITPDTGYDGLDEVDITINAVPTGSVTMPSSITASGGTAFYTTQATLVVSASATATPDVTTAGYISSGTSGTTSLVVATTIPTVNAQTLYPSTTDQTIPTNRYTKGTQTIKAVTTNNIIASNIKSGVTVEVGDADDPDRVLSVTGTYSGGTSTCDTKTMTNDDSQATSIEFTNLSGEPKWFFVRCTSQLTRASSYSYYFITDIRYNGTNHNGNYYRRSNGTYYNDTLHYSHTYSNGTLTVSSSANRGAAGGSFYNGNYELVYIY